MLLHPLFITVFASHPPPPQGAPHQGAKIYFILRQTCLANKRILTPLCTCHTMQWFSFSRVCGLIFSKFDKHILKLVFAVIGFDVLNGWFFWVGFWPF